MDDNKVDYSVTLNLPKTDFKMRGDLSKKEPEILKNVFEDGLYEKVLKKNEGHDHYILHDGPPYANGEIHMGHAMNKVLKDTIVRYKSMKGFYAPFIPGFDTHGMPTEKKAIEKLNLDRSKIPVPEFRDMCKKVTSDYKDLQTAGFKRLGVLGDWEHPYITYDRNIEASQLGIFGKMYFNGYIYRGLKPVYWCPDCETALAEAEIEYKNHESLSLYVKFNVIDAKGLFDEKNTSIVIWTTTPWTLPGNTGITVGGDFDYSVVEAGNERYIIASELVEKVMKIAGIEEYREVQRFKGNEMNGILCKHPFLDRNSRVVIGSETTVNVDVVDGTGAVHTAPAYGKEDYLQGLKDNLDMEVCVDAKGHQTEGAGQFAGMFYAKSNKAIAAWLEENGYLLKAVPIKHSYPHCWRCKNPVIYRATDQWFCSVDKFRQNVLDAVETVKWHPLDWGKQRMQDMIKGRNDWCISRQRTWGVPLPVFYCEDCNKEYITKESIEKIQEIVRKEGTNAWWSKTAEELLPENAKCECGCKKFKKETDIMDVWFDSGSTYETVLNQRGLGDVADLYLEGNDQYRGWFQSSLLTSVATKNQTPYREVLCCGMVVDGQGRKMSKSLGNGVAPQEIFDKYGADILRLWVLSSNYEMDVSYSEDIIRGVSDVYRKIRNTIRFLLGNLYDYDVENPVPYDKLQEIDKWALTRLNKLIKDATYDYDTFDFNDCYHDVNQFCVVDMSNTYLDVIKDRLYTEKADSEARRAAQTTMYYILDALVKILTPMTSYTVEEIWKEMKHTKDEQVESPMLTNYPEFNEEWDNVEIIEKWKKILDIKSMVSKELELARNDKLIGNSLDAKVILNANEEFDFINENKDIFKEVLIVSQLEVNKVDGEFAIEVLHADGEKCERCWKYDVDLKDGLCPHCRKVLGK